MQYGVLGFKTKSHSRMGSYETASAQRTILENFSSRQHFDACMCPARYMHGCTPNISKMTNKKFILNIRLLVIRLFDSITIGYGALNPPCAEGAPLPLWDAGAEIQDRVNQKLSARQWTDPKKTVTNDIPSY